MAVIQRVGKDAEKVQSQNGALLWQTERRILKIVKKKKKEYIWSSNPLPEIHHRHLHVRCSIKKTQKPKCPQTDKLVQKMWNTPTKHYSTCNRKEILLYALTRWTRRACTKCNKPVSTHRRYVKHLQSRDMRGEITCCLAPTQAQLSMRNELRWPICYS